MFYEIALNFLVILVVIIAFSMGMTIIRAPGGYADGLDVSMLNILKVCSKFPVLECYKVLLLLHTNIVDCPCGVRVCTCSVLLRSVHHIWWY